MAVAKHPPEKHFLRFTAEDPAALGEQIARAEATLALASSNAAVVRASVELGALLTTARRETEAVEILQAAWSRAQVDGGEGLGWLLLYLGTARQYLGQPGEALALFCEALGLAREGGHRGLESYVLHHTGRLHAECDAVEAAREAFTGALVLRRSLGDPRSTASERALEMLDRGDWRGSP